MVVWARSLFWLAMLLVDALPVPSLYLPVVSCNPADSCLHGLRQRRLIRLMGRFATPHCSLGTVNIQTGAKVPPMSFIEVHGCSGCYVPPRWRWMAAFVHAGELPTKYYIVGGCVSVVHHVSTCLPCESLPTLSVLRLPMPTMRHRVAV